jgi:type II secretory pathway component PulF
MQFFKQLPLSSLIEFCRVLRHNLAAGLTLRHVFQQQARRGPLAVRPVAARIAGEIEAGNSLEDALEQEKDYFPPIFVSLATVGEHTGNLPEVLADLEKYFLLQQRLQRQFISQIAWPMFQFIVAPFIIAGMIFFLAILSTPGPGGKTWDPLGFGYTGTNGALLFLIHFFGTFAALIALYFVITRTLRQQAAVHDVLLRLPVLGPTMRAVALMRFCMALRLTMETGMSIVKAIRLSMKATGNEAIAARAEIAVESLRSGDDLTVALSKCGVFPLDFLDIMANAEEGGRVPEVMHHQADYYEDEARRRMTILTRVASWGVYVGVAAMIIFMIFRIAGSIWGGGGIYDQILQGKF